VTTLAFVQNYHRLRDKFRPAPQRYRLRNAVPVKVHKPEPPPPPPKPPFTDNEWLDAHIANVAMAAKAAQPHVFKRTPAMLISQVAAQHGVTVDAITGTARFAPIVAARAEAYYLLRTECSLSLNQIGARLNKDHTTVMNGIRKYCARNGAPYPAGFRNQSTMKSRKDPTL